MNPDGGTDGVTAGATDTRVDAGLRNRLQVIAGCLGLTCLATSTRPGNLLADTKIDMPVNPVGFLGRALHLWDTGQFGQLQNQAAGYLFPMGPFYALGRLAGLPGWIIQRLWLALLLCLAFTGARRLAARLGIEGNAARLAAGLTYALSPVGLATLGQISSDYLPFAMTPWIVLPLITAVHSRPERGARRRLIVTSVARSALAVACAGGINATATVAVLVVPLLYLLTRPRGSPRLRILACWSIAVALATVWWTVPLLLTGRYGFSWLTYTEKAAVTTGPTGLVNVLRGAERWVSYLRVDGQVWWPLGHALSVSTLPVLCTGAVAALGLAGLLRPRLPERAFVLCTLLTGVMIVVAGHISAVESPLAAPVRELLDGPLAPLRNLHRFDVLIRLPIALGVAHLIALMSPVKARPRTLAITYVALGGIAATVLGNGLSGPGDFREIPTYWRDAAAWLNERAGRQGVLAVPGSTFGDHLWGRPMDDVMQPLLTARWGVRQLVPAGSAGYTRALDAIEQAVAAGRRSPGLAEFLARMGVRYVVVRNDLRRDGLRGAWPARVHQTLDEAAGLHRVAVFGGTAVGGPLVDDATEAFDQRYPPLEIYEVATTATADAATVTLTEADRAIRLYGSPEALLTMAGNGVLKDRPVLLGDDAPDLDATPVASDSLRPVKRNFGELRQSSPTLTASERHLAGDITDRGWARLATVAAFSGIKAVTASSSAADPDAIPQLHDPGRLPFAAVDGNPWTHWETDGRRNPVGQWLRVDFDRPTVPDQVAATFVYKPDTLGPPPSRVAVQTETGTVAQPVRAGSSPQFLRVPPGRTRWLRVRILALAPPIDSLAGFPLFARAGISELTIGGVHAGRHYRLPEITWPGTTPPSFVLARGPGTAGSCMKGAARWVCAAALGRQDEENGYFDRAFVSPAAGLALVSGTTTLTDPALIERFTALGAQIKVTASSSRSAEPAVLARSAFDADPATTWIAGDGDIAPRLTVHWGRRRLRIDHITIKRPPGAYGLLRVRVRGDNGDAREGLLDADGRLDFAPLTTRRLTFTFMMSGQFVVQISDITVPGVRPFPRLGAFPLRLRCGFGPGLEINGVTIATRVEATMQDLLEGRPLRFEACRALRFTAGVNRLRPVPFSPYRIESAVLDGGGSLRGAPAAPAGRPQVLKWSQGTRELRVRAGRRSLLVVNENFNAGWRARMGRAVLSPVRLDGWKQAWIVPAGAAGTVRLTYEPDRIHRPAVFIGLGLLPMLLIVACRPVRAPAVPRPPLRRPWRAYRVALTAPLAAGLGFWVAGVPGLATAFMAAGGYGWALIRARRSVLARVLASPWPVAALMLTGTVSCALGAVLDGPGDPLSPADVLRDPLPQLLGLLALVRIVTALCGDPTGDSAGHPAGDSTAFAPAVPEGGNSSSRPAPSPPPEAADRRATAHGKDDR